MKWNRILALFACATLSLSVAACGGDDDDDNEKDAGAGGVFDGLYLEVQTGDVGQVFRQKLGLALQGVFRIVVNNGVFGQRERCVFVQVDMLWEWNDLVVSFGDFLFAAGKECCTKHNSQKQP